MVEQCLGCYATTLRSLIDLGQQPPSNQFLAQRGEACEVHPLELLVCDTCGLGQLSKPISPSVVRSRFDWITYNEPEGHLDNLVDLLVASSQLSTQAKIVGITYKDDSTLARFQEKGIADTYRLKQEADLRIDVSLASLETIQQVLTPELAEHIASKIGQADILMVRHILEHAHHPNRLLDACNRLCKPDGLMVFEVPDCRKVLEGHDHCFLWEEHISYFTPDTLRTFLLANGYAETDMKIYPYPMEDSLVAIVRNVRSSPIGTGAHVDSELARLGGFAGSLHARGRDIKAYLEELQTAGKHVALFGAGHLAAKFINFYALVDCLVGVIDDNPNKLGRLMPGSNLPIIGSGCLETGDVDLCLLTLNPESEQKVRKAQADYLARGGQFRSIFSASSSSIYKDIEHDRA